MPLLPCQNQGRIGWKWGESGVCYTGSDARRRALQQGIAITLNERSQGKQVDFSEFADCDDNEFTDLLMAGQVELPQIMAILATRNKNC